MDLPLPARILWADVCRDGGSYELAFADARERLWHLRLRVRLRRRWLWWPVERRAGYAPPVMRGPGSDGPEHVLTWDAAEALRAALAPMLGPHIEMGGAPRATAMLDYLGKRGGL
jgi:hypothetical protein